MSTPCATCGTLLAEAHASCPVCAVTRRADSQNSAIGTATPPPTPAGSAPASGPPPPLSATARFLPGEILSGRYRVIYLIGRGGMGEVYRAHDLMLGQDVALKFLPERLGRSAAASERLRHEAGLARQVTHPYVCRVHDIGTHDGRLFLAMEYVDGEDLASLLRRIGQIPERKGLDIAHQLCMGLAAIHQRGVLHRDLKPSNVMIDANGRVRITDFGIARAVQQTGSDDGVSGTPAYMAPEQFDGNEVPIRTDLYALGLLLYEMFSGRPAFRGGSVPDLALRQRTEMPRPLAEVVTPLDPRIDRAVDRCLQKDPRRRPNSALAIAAALPGSDPLAAAMLAGETPAPEMVAAAARSSGLTRLSASFWIAGLLLLLWLVAVVAPQAQPFRRADLTKTPDALADRAASLLDQYAPRALRNHRAHGFAYDQTYLEEAPQLGITPGPDSMRPALTFWYRESPEPLVPLAMTLRASEMNAGRVSATDPPPFAPGMASVRLDPRGELLALEIRHVDSGDPAKVALPVDFQQLFEQAGLDPISMHSIPPRWTPSAPTTNRSAWEARRRDGVAVRVEAGRVGDSLAYFYVVRPWDHSPSELPPPYPPSLQIAAVVSMAIYWLVVIIAAVVARTNLRRGRGDRRGGWRVAVVCFFTYLLAWFLAGSHSGHLYFGTWLFVGATGLACYYAGSLLVLYMALEPFLRRRWPDTLVAWSRLIAGQLRDPLLGRDLLIGTVVGTLFGLMRLVDRALPEWLGWSTLTPVPPGTELPPDALLGTSFSLGFLLLMLPRTFLETLFGMCMLAFLRFAWRRTWPAALTFTLLLAPVVALPWSRPTDISLALAVVLVALHVYVMIRYGLLAAFVALFLRDVLSVFGLSLDTSLWFTNLTMVPLIVTVGLAALGCWAAFSDRSPYAELEPRSLPSLGSR